MLCIKNLFNYLNLTESKRVTKRWPYHAMTSEAILWECHRLVLYQTGGNEMVDELGCSSSNLHFLCRPLLAQRSILLLKMMSLPVPGISAIGPGQPHTLIGRGLLL